MPKKSLMEVAAKANGRSRACAKCKFMLSTIDVCSVCTKSFKEGFVKGYKFAKKK